MPEISYPIERKFIVYEVIYICDKCEEGHMWTDNTVISTDVILYPHTCKQCGDKMNFGKMYPGIEYGS